MSARAACNVEQVVRGRALVMDDPVKLFRFGRLILDPRPEVQEVIDPGALLVHALTVGAGGDVVGQRVFPAAAVGVAPNRPALCKLFPAPMLDVDTRPLVAHV